MFRLFKKFKETHVNVDILNDILPPSYEISKKEEAKTKAWKEISRKIKEQAFNETANWIAVLDDVYKAIPFEELKDTLVLQGYSLQRTDNYKFTKSDYDSGWVLHIVW